MAGDILLSTAYFPPSEYFSLIKNAGTVSVETQENYIKQTYRNRCRILSANGILSLSVPIKKGSHKKALIRDVSIDYSKRWQQIHLRALTSAYNRSPYFLFYFEDIEKILLKNHGYLLDLNNNLLETCLEILKINKCITYTSTYLQAGSSENDFRYKISPKSVSGYQSRKYIQVFSQDGFIPRLSILDLIFNQGPESSEYL